MNENDVLFQKVTQAYSEKYPSAPIRSRTYDLPITSSDALTLSYRRLVRAKAIKLIGALGFFSEYACVTFWNNTSFSTFLVFSLNILVGCPVILTIT